MLKSLVNIQSAFAHTRWFLICLLSSNLIVLGCVAWMALSFKEEQKEKIYALQGEKPLMFALNQNTTDNRGVEAEATLLQFHELFFEQIPDANSIEERLQRAISMSDNSVLTAYKSLKENRYFQQLTEAGIISRFTCDSIRIDLSHYPYQGRLWGKNIIIRKSSSTTRNIATSCRLRNCARSKDTPHGFLLEEWAGRMEDME